MPLPNRSWVWAIWSWTYVYSQHWDWAGFEDKIKQPSPNPTLCKEHVNFIIYLLHICVKYSLICEVSTSLVHVFSRNPEKNSDFKNKKTLKTVWNWFIFKKNIKKLYSRYSKKLQTPYILKQSNHSFSSHFFSTPKSAVNFNVAKWHLIYYKVSCVFE